MKKAFKVLAVLTILTGVGYLVVRRVKKHRKLKHVADNGYETARDVLYPGKHVKSRKLHYGPVLPHSK